MWMADRYNDDILLVTHSTLWRDFVSRVRDFE